MPVREAVRFGLALFWASPLYAQAPDVLVADLNHADAKKRRAAKRTLARTLPDKAVPLLADSLPRFKFSGQNYGAIILARYPFKRTRTVLRELLDCGTPYLELTSAIVLYQNHDKKVAGTVIGKIVTAKP